MIPRAHLSVSSDVLPEFREFERLSTDGHECLRGAGHGRYLRRFEERVAALASMPDRSSSIRTAACATVEQVARAPGLYDVVRAERRRDRRLDLATRAGHPRIITFDMGGTSTDVSVVEQRRRR